MPRPADSQRVGIDTASQTLNYQSTYSNRLLQSQFISPRLPPPLLAENLKISHALHSTSRISLAGGGRHGGHGAARDPAQIQVLHAMRPPPAEHIPDYLITLVNPARDGYKPSNPGRDVCTYITYSAPPTPLYLPVSVIAIVTRHRLSRDLRHKAHTCTNDPTARYMKKKMYPKDLERIRILGSYAGSEHQIETYISWSAS